MADESENKYGKSDAVPNWSSRCAPPMRCGGTEFWNLLPDNSLDRPDQVASDEQLKNCERISHRDIENEKRREKSLAGDLIWPDFRAACVEHVPFSKMESKREIRLPWPTTEFNVLHITRAARSAATTDWLSVSLLFFHSLLLFEYLAFLF